jgi:hypothetical protein
VLATPELPEPADALQQRLSLLMFAYLFTWTMEVAKENRSFV